MAELWNSADRCPACRRVAVLARDRNRAVRIPDGCLRRSDAEAGEQAQEDPFPIQVPIHIRHEGGRK